MQVCYEMRQTEDMYNTVFVCTSLIRSCVETSFSPLFRFRPTLDPAEPSLAIRNEKSREDTAT